MMASPLDFLHTAVQVLWSSSGYNTQVVAVGAVLLGWAAGMAGTFLLVRKRSLFSDALSHATLPGVGIAFLVMAALGGSGRFLPGLLAGAALSALLGLWAVLWLTRNTRLSDDAAIGAVLSSFFGFGVVILTIIQSVDIGRQAGIATFLLGSTSGMLFSEAVTLAVLAAMVSLVIIVMRRTLTLVAFDDIYAQTRGIAVARADLVLLLVVLAITVIGLKVVGLILVIALIIIPPVAARFWTDRIAVMAILSGMIGALSGLIGVVLSAAVADLPAGPIIVLSGTGFFIVSFLLAPRRGLVFRSIHMLRKGSWNEEKRGETMAGPDHGQTPSSPGTSGA